MMASILIAERGYAAFITIGNAGNADDTTGYGGVGYEYMISATEVSSAEFAASGAKIGSSGLSESWWGASGPASFVNLYEAMRYCNYLTTGNADTGYYQNDGDGTWSANVLSHEAYAVAHGLTYFVPTEDEWYKAAYYTGSGYTLYATGNSVPVAGVGGENYNNAITKPWAVASGTVSSIENNGTFDMSGNVWEWVEDDSGIIRGGTYNAGETLLRSTFRYSGFAASFEDRGIGFRPVAIPEPMTMGLFGLFGAGALLYRRIFLL